MKFSQTFRVAAEDIDEQGHANNVAYVRWVQTVAVAHWFHRTSEEIRRKYTWVLLRHEIDYKREAFSGDEITIVTWVGEWSAVRCERFVEIFRGEELLAKSRTVWCMLDRKTSKPARISAELKELFQAR